MSSQAQKFFVLLKKEGKSATLHMCPILISSIWTNLPLFCHFLEYIFSFRVSFMVYKKLQKEIQSALLASKNDGNVTSPVQPTPNKPPQKANSLMDEEKEMLASFVEACKVQKEEINETHWESVILQPSIINALRTNIEVGLLMYSMGFKDAYVGHLAYGVPGTGKSTCVDAIFTSLKNSNSRA